MINHYYDELGKIMEAGFRTEFDALDKLAASKEKTAFSSPLDFLGRLGPGAVLGTSAGREASKQTAAMIAPRGRKTRSEAVAAKAGIPASIIGALAGIYAMRGKPAAKTRQILLKKFDKLTLKEIDAIMDYVYPAMTGFGGGALGGAAAGGVVGGVARAKGSPYGKRKHASIAGRADDPGESPTDEEKDPKTDELEHCRECGAPVRKDDRFCKKCGAKIILEMKSIPVTQKQRKEHTKKERGDEDQKDTGADAAIRESDLDMSKAAAKKIPNKWLKQFFPQSAHGAVDLGIGSAAVAAGLYGAHKAHKVFGPMLEPPKAQGMIRTASAKKTKKRVINPVWNIRNAKKRHRISEALARSRR